MKYDVVADVIALLGKEQGVEHDNRDKVREVTHFLEKEDGQWEPSIINTMKGRPRYTFDLCNPVVDSIAGEIEQADFGIKIRPAGGDASIDTAKTINGMVRNIQSMSDSQNVYNMAARRMVACGFDAWRVTQEWGDGFDQDLFIRKIANASSRVWWDANAEKQDMSDANHCFVLQSMTLSAYKEKFPEGSGMSISDDNSEQVYTHKKDEVIVGEILYKKPKTIEIVLMNDNSVYEVDDEFEMVVDELRAKGVTEVRRRDKQTNIVCSRIFDGSTWLTKEQDTVFTYIPVVPVYANFLISENKVIYRGVVNNLMDPQRVYNYVQSREVEEGALAPRGKYWLTREQAEADVKTLSTMNTNADPVQTYTHKEGQPPPFWQGGAQVNQGLQLTAQNMSQNIIAGSGIFSANKGDAPNQSGKAIELQQNKGDTSTIKYFKAQEVAITHTARIIVDAIPKVYDTKRIVRVLGEDGSSKMEPINDSIYDEQTGQQVELNDLSKGAYDVTCDVGSAFKNRQEETARAFIDVATIDPSIVAMGKDVWLSNLQVPGFDLIAERARKQLLEAGQIPDSQMTDEEKEKAQEIIDAAQANPPQPAPMDIAIMEQTQANTADIQSKAQERQDKAQLAAQKQELDEAKFMVEAQEKQAKMFADNQIAIVNALNTQADTLNKITSAIGVDAIVSQDAIEIVDEQAELISELQEKSDG